MGRLLAGAVVGAMALAPSAAASGGAQLGLIHIDPRFGAEVETVDAGGAPVATLLPEPGKRFPQPWFLSSVGFSGDGSVVITPAVRKPPTRTNEPELGLYAIPADGGAPAQIPGTDGGYFPVGFPGGRTFAFMRSRGTNSEEVSGEQVLRRTRARTSIWIGDLDGGRARRLTPWRTDGYDVPTSVSPDGSTLALTRVRTAGPGEGGFRRRSEAILLNLGTGRSTPVGRNAAIASFSPDGTRLALTVVHRFERPHVRETESGKTVLYGEGDIFVEDLATGARTRITSGPAADTDPSWDPSGQRLAFRRYDDLLASEGAAFGLGDSIYEVNADGSCLTRVLHGAAGGFTAPVWRPGAERGSGPIAC